MKINTTIVTEDTMNFLADKAISFMIDHKKSDENFDAMRDMLHGHIHEITTDEISVLLIEKEVQSVVQQRIIDNLKARIFKS